MNNHRPSNDGNEALHWMSPTALRSAMAWLNFPAPLQSELIAMTGIVTDDPVLARYASDLFDAVTKERAGLDQPYSTWLSSPDCPPEFRNLLPLLTLVASVPSALGLHRDKGIPSQISADTFDDLVRWAKHFHRIHGRWGVDEMAWLVKGFVGKMYRLGRLQFEITSNRWELNRFSSNQMLLSVHIPDMGAIEAGACDSSFQQAIAFFVEHYPEYDFAAFVCDSWLLDPQLRDYFPETSNIIRFQRRFDLIKSASYRSDDILRRVRHDAPVKNSLQQALIQHQNANKKWYAGVGIIEINSEN